MINQDDSHQDLAHEIKASTGIDFNCCLHCKTCANGCPFIEGMDYAPNAVIRLIQFGMEEEALNSSTIWVCVGCDTCSSCCPMAIDIPGVMDGLRHKAIKQGIKIAEPDILNFHTEVLNTVKKYGRTHKLEIMMRYKLKTMDLLSDIGMGLKMLKKRKLDLTPSKIQDKKAIGKIFKKK
ncbi:MAG: heterodisulfide reductase [Desulfobacula sp.]|jgi:heterodisulfide reductase subunit C|nr:heterodisulfide reductase [Desulfobacula sp.]